MSILTIQFFGFLCLCGTVIFAGCGGRSVIPDAPPPYPTYSTPGYEPQTSTGSYPSSSAFTPAPHPENRFDHSSTYIPGNINSYADIYSPPPAKNSSPSLKPRYSIIAQANLWVLVQDEFGTEIDWKKLSSGENMAINHPRPVTVTCSSGSKVQILDSKGKKVDTLSNSSGIAIVRLP
jgi:hypothetical protein